MFKLTIMLLGLTAGGIAAVLKAAKAPEPLPADHSPLAEFKRHAKAAVDAGKEEAAKTEAQILKEYEDAKSPKR